MYKYLIGIPIPNTYVPGLHHMMDIAARLADCEPLYVQTPDHMTFHKPIFGVDERTLLNTVQGVALKCKQTRVRALCLDQFDDQFIVIVVVGTQSFADFWSQVNQSLRVMPEYPHDPSDGDNTMHVTIAKNLGESFPMAWEVLMDYRFRPINVKIDTIVVWRKPIGSGSWDEIARYPIPQ